MANNVKRNGNGSGLSYPIRAMLIMAFASGILVALSFYVIQFWPLPVAVAPYFEDSLLPTGFVWGFIGGGFFGFIIGLLTDEQNFIDVTYE